MSTPAATATAPSASASASHVHPIQVVARRTGLSVDVIRAWEKRHAVVSPVRSETGRRLYSDADIERLRLIARGTAGGRTVAQAAALAPDALAALVRAEAAAPAPTPRDAGVLPPAHVHLEACLAAVARFDGMELDAALRRATIALPAETFLEGIVVQLWQEVAERVHDGALRPSQQHLTQAVLRRVLDRVTEAATHPGASPDLVVATPAGQMQELGALLTAATAATAGWRVIYLGPGLPAEDVAEAAERTGAAAVAVSLGTAPGDRVVARELRRLRALLPEPVAIVAEGAAADAYGNALRAIGAHVVRDVAALLSRLHALRSAHAAPGTPATPA
jgi:DNA-binding transcriptional MerR regulator/methylmalonyl-CoA mutase cobalamin-binding subunit